ncbi:DUF305 domain-containing protein [Chitinophaga sancti]|uniref:DUF305 domain-containing protein n=1 Tax=Chitinophaga sancti TaxID=1004 RepID=UPI002A75C6F2|nr:DUF305 domain-containing protein [Chitinophaga sancti]WPQ62554.1 DUF305 domain-containing protein [Chitinophaga sancti]
MSYKRFFITLGLSFIIMYVVMFLNVDEVSHVYLSITRLYMTILMVAPMALIMLLMMGKMYANKKLNYRILASSAVIFIIVLVMLRKQFFISDAEYMRAMIPHHSSAILTSKHADIQDPEVKKLSNSIIESQEREIAIMKAKLKEMEN